MHLAASYLAPSFIQLGRICHSIGWRHVTRRCAALCAFGLWLVASWHTVHAQSMALGFTQLPQPDDGLITVFYPSSTPETQARQGVFDFSWADGGQVLKGNGHLIVISHGSGGSPWVHVDLARALVQRGFTVALPQHAGDNYLDPSNPGPDSWVKRPGEVSRAIDVVMNTPSLAVHLDRESVGIFGGSAGGHTALSMAGGQWSKRRFRDHCALNIRQDFSSCVGFFTLLRGDWLDGPKIWAARAVIAARFFADTTQGGFDPRVRSAVAMVPFSADFDPESLRYPKTALGLVIADGDINQIPRFHVEAVLKACAPRCEVVMRLPDAGHGAMLSPMPPLTPGSVADHLLSDPPGFDRTQRIPELNANITDYFLRTLVLGK